MKYNLLLILLGFSLCANSQNNELIGSWFWSGSEDYDVLVKYNEKECQITGLGKGTKSKLSESYFLYEVKNDTILYKNYSENNDTLLFSYILSEVNDTYLKTIDPNDGACFNYNKISSEPPKIEPHKLNEFYQHNNAIVCVADTEIDNYRNALSIGDINIDDSFEETLRKLGKPYKVMEGNKGLKNYIFLIDRLENSVNYMVVSAKSDTIQAIQFTGSTRNEKFKFSSIRLGDYSNYVYQKFGNRFKEKRVEQIKGISWDYYPFTFSFEFVEDRVYSIRVYR